jgi:hypothetical protein
VEANANDQKRGVDEGSMKNWRIRKVARKRGRRLTLIPEPLNHFSDWHLRQCPVPVRCQANFTRAVLFDAQVLVDF